ncbi:BppU family phage baseplate upper protein [Enterococcus malodoratus]|uniref:BppU family phage baseplate upper protein n=1 Tax=Enterococcus malodoratus TaxID=71451 RepID=UPI0022E2C050|nr:BppU family phage baseplate upper protein [Enterococcus malodoratus]
MFKTKEEVIVIQAEATDPITTGVVFWSHDKGTAKLLFQLKKGTVSQTLAKGTIVPICLVFNGGRHIYHAVIEDAVNGIVSIVLEDNILGYVGRVEGSIYIELPDSRSLDTAGRFTFDIKRSPIDENVPELKDYYWQGFNEIMAQYHQTIATIKLEAKALLDSLTTDVTKVKNDIATANVKIAEIRKKLDDNDVFTKAESSANVVYQIFGKEKVRTIIRLDFVGKKVNSLVENRNVGKFSNANTSILLPNSTNFFENSQNAYDGLEKLDEQYMNGSITIRDGIAQELLSYDVLPLIRDFVGEQYFIDHGVQSAEDYVLVARNIVKSMSSHVVGSGLSANGDSLLLKTYVNDSNWSVGGGYNTSSSIQDLNHTLSNSNADFISLDGKIHATAYAGKSDGSTPSQIKLDHAYVDIVIELSANEHIKYLIAANHVENLATQLEAETGTDNAKAMTPLRTAQQINKKAVTIAGNQTIGGIKNFKDGLMINDDLVVSKNDHSVFILDSTTSSVIADGKLYFILHGSLVVVEGSIKFKTGVAYLAMISSSLPNSMIATISNGILVGSAGNDSAKGIFVENGTKNIKASSVFVANEWFTCNGVYWVGKE